MARIRHDGTEEPSTDNDPKAVAKAEQDQRSAIQSAAKELDGHLSSMRAMDDTNSGDVDHSRISAARKELADLKSDAPLTDIRQKSQALLEAINITTPAGMPKDEKQGLELRRAADKLDAALKGL